jgi:hypothetical protein
MDATAARAPANPAGPSPLRRPGSVRRTSSIDSSWPQGIGQPMKMRGRARDLLTPADNSAARILSDDWMALTATLGRQIDSIETSRRNDDVQALIGCRGGGHLRKEIARVIPDEQAQGTPLHLLLDDFSGASLVAGWAWSRWNGDWMERMRTQAVANAANAPAAAIPNGPGRNGQMEGICSGFRPGSSALRADGTSNPAIQSSAAVPPLPHPADPIGWHDLAEQEGVGMRRARRIDVWLEHGRIQIDMGFQDSATSPTGGDRIAVHEYRVIAVADPETLELLSVEVDPRVLPYPECPAASPNASRMAGEKLPGFRLAVLDTLPGTLGCTHLNDVLRSMADVPQLVRRLREEL